MRLSGCGCDDRVVRKGLVERVWRSLGGKGGWGRIDIRRGGSMSLGIFMGCNRWNGGG